MTRIIIFVLTLLFMPTLAITAGEIDNRRCDEAFKGYVKPLPDEVHIGKLGIGMPVGRFLLVRKDNLYCAIRFNKYWTEKDGKEKYSLYEVYCQRDGSGDFLNKNVEFKERKASFLPPRGIFYPLIWQTGTPEVICGSMKLVWDSMCDVNHVCFFELSDHPAGEYGIKLAPTPWADIKEVNVHDVRIRWYKYDVSREEVNIPVDKIWNGK